MNQMDVNNLAQYLDLANHHPEATPEDIKEVCEKVKKYGFHTAFVNGCYVPLAREILGEEGKVGTVISFPLGQDSQDAKVVAAIDAAKNGADELDVSMNVGLFKAGEKELVRKEMEAIVLAAKGIKKTVIVKFIIETGLLSDEEIKEASLLVFSSGADFVKTNSGLGPRGASLEDIRLIKEVVGGQIKIKAAGGIDTQKEAMAFIEAGVNRIGTSHAVEIIEDINNGEKHGGE
jgi:deoxyribose-phosphate aldolase